MKKIIALLIALVMVLGLTACGGGDDEKEDSNVIELDGSTAVYTGAEIAPDADGADSIVVYFDYTNGADEAKSFFWSFFYTLKQGDTELETSVTWKDEASFETVNDSTFVDVEPGATHSVAISYNLIDRTTPVVIRFSDLFDEEAGVITIDPATLREAGGGSGSASAEGGEAGYYLVDSMVMEGEKIDYDMLVLMGMADNTYAFFKEDGTVDISMEGEVMTFDYADGVITSEVFGGTYEFDGDMVTIDIPDIGMTLVCKLTDGEPSGGSAAAPTGFSEEMVAEFAGDWHGLAVLYDTSGDYAENDGDVFEIVARFAFDEAGNLTPYILYYVNGGQEIEGLELYEVDGYFAMDVYGSFLGEELISSELYVDDYGALYIIIHTDDGNGNVLNVQGCLRRLDDEWDENNDFPCPDKGFNDFYGGKSLEEILVIYGLDPSVLPEAGVGAEAPAGPVASGEGIVDFETLKAGFAYYLTENHPNNNYRRPSYEEVVEHFGGVEGKKDRDDLWSDTLHIYRWDTPDGSNWVIMNFSVDAEGEHGYSVSWSTGLNETQKTYGW